MILERVTSEGIAHHSYLVGSGGEAVVIDPRRDIGVYLEKAGKNDLRITRVFETHRNEDYVIGSLELAGATGASIHHGASLPFAYGETVRDGDRFRVGSLEIRVLETPGHTEESLSLAVSETDSPKRVLAVFTGDALFAGDTGRTDLLPGREKEMAGNLYESLHRKILPLGDDVILCPAHGAGSVCGANIADRDLSTLGYERAVNPQLRMDRQAFIAHKMAERHHTPAYFRQMEQYNLQGPPPLPKHRFLPPLPVNRVKELAAAGAWLLDIRLPTSFAGGHIPGSLNIWRQGMAAFAGYFLTYDRPLVIIDDFNLELEPVHRQLVRLGFDRVEGYLAGGFFMWARAGETVRRSGTLSVQELKERIGDPSVYLLDVRDRSNYDRFGHLPGANQVYVSELPPVIPSIPREKEIITFCDAGYKSSIAASLLLREGFTRVSTVLGSMAAWRAAGFPVER
ncbi:MAG: MBL fold metallo-hydrolase [Methanomicrobiales archaeon]|nr:MBL fold metallo-hydrolase [Methanomicrobiales archaeon]